MGNIFKKIGLYLLGLFLGFCLIISATTAAFRFTVGSPDTVKNLVEKSGAYQTLTDGVLDTLAKQNNTGTGSIPLKAPAIQKTIHRAFSPEILRNNSEGFIDGMYGWLGGETSTPNFTIDLTKSKQTLAKGIGDYAKKRLKSLPVCSPYMVPARVDVFTIKCLPAGTDINKLVARAENQLLNDKNFLPDTKITSQEISKDAGFSDVFSQDSPLPSAFQAVRTAFFVLIALVILLSAVVIWLTKDMRAGLKRLAKIYAKSGAAILLLALMLKFFAPKAFDNEAFKSNQVADKVAAPLAKQFVLAIGNVYLVFGLFVLILSGLIGIFYWYKYLRVPKPSVAKV